MERSVLSIIILSACLLLPGCGSQNVDNTEAEQQQIEVPPSLQPGIREASTINLSSKEVEELKIQTQKVTGNKQKYSVSAPGVVFYAPEHSSIISVPIDGQVSQIFKKEGEWVRSGEVLFHIRSLAFGSLVSEYLQAFAEEQYQINNLERIEQLVKETISSTSELEQARAEFQRANVSSRAAYSKLKAIGVTDQEINLFTESGDIDPILKIRSPISGSVQQNFVELGQSVNALQTLSRILDTREVQIRGYLSPNIARIIQKGDPVTISKREESELVLESVVGSVNPGLDESSKSVVVNIYISTRNGWPKPGENVHLEILTSSEKNILTIPIKALTYDGNDAMVFVKIADNLFEKRNVIVNSVSDQIVFIEEGLKEGEEIAVSQVFSLKAILRLDMITEE